MAYDRYDTRRDRDWRGNEQDRGGRRDERGFFERAGDEISSWFGDDDAERRRLEDERRQRMQGDDSSRQGRDYDRGYGRDYDRDRSSFSGSSRNPDRDRSQFGDENRYGSAPMSSTSDRSYRSGRLGYAGYDRDYSARGGMGGSGTDYMSATGPSFGYGGTYGAGNDRGYGSGGFGREFEGHDMSRSESRFGSNRDNDRHYHSWRQRQLNELDRDYDQYCRERQDRFENDFGSWRQNRLGKRQQLSGIREHMEVVGNDGETVGTVDCVKGDHVVLTKSDSDDKRHHAIDCSMIQSIEGDQVRLDVPAEEAKTRWEDAEHRGFFGRDRKQEDEMNLNRSFAGTYEDR